MPQDMSFIALHTEISNLLLGAWKIDEDELFFLTRLKLYENEWKKLATISHPNKRLEWLSSRLCMKELLKIDHLDRVESLSAQDGKPYLSNHTYQISYTHSHKYSAAIAAPNSKVGIDIEYLKRKRNMKTSYLFMNEQEKEFYNNDPIIERFILIWSAKETIYKTFGQRGVSFKDDIFLNFESFKMNKTGILPAIVDKGGIIKPYNVHYHICPEFVLTYTIDPIPQMVYEY